MHANAHIHVSTCACAGCITSIKVYIRNIHLDNSPLQYHIQNQLMLLRQDFQMNAMQLSKDINSTGVERSFTCFVGSALEEWHIIFLNSLIHVFGNQKEMSFAPEGY